jgi:16S rRNA (adenine1518-N6/adenine1519-N6)-dimethyltransferase
MSRQRLGQHYLTDRQVINKIVANANIRPDEWILEIGTGRGVLTRELVHLGAGLEAYEIDRENLAATLEELSPARAVIHLGDVFKETPCFDVLVSSLPYSRSATFVEWISQLEYNRALVLLQKDFVSKILAPPGSRDYRAISAIAQISSEVKVLMRVDRDSFSPPPRVSSLLVSVKPKRKMTGAEILRVKRFFSLRRREVVSVMAKLGMTQHKTNYDKRRVYSLTPEEVLEICSYADGSAGVQSLFAA